MINVKQEILTGFIARELDPLTKAHSKESRNCENIPLHIDWEEYIRIQKSNALILFVARDGDNKAVGYMACVVSKSLHYACTQCYVNAVYITYEHRGGRLFGLLISAMEERIKLSGVELIYFHVKVKQDFSKFLMRKGYDFVEKLMIKRMK